ncbi:MAG: hypothetical protein IKU48_03995 [Clostridia bacterium]|nr:hypothetical protein [Clostridia bacterium]
MIDLHTHFLPEMDDGAKNVDESILMLREAYKQGVSVCAGTSHIVLHSESNIEAFLKKRDNAIVSLRKKLVGSENLVPKLIYGAEVFLDNDISKYNGVEKLCLTGTNLLLVEFPTREYNPEYAEWLYSLTLKGIVPVIAHFERYSYINELLDDLDSVNVAYQMNAKTVMKNSWFKFILGLYYHEKKVLISSDMHNMGLRKTCMKKAYDKICKYYSKEVAGDFFENTASQLISTVFIK